MDKRNSPAGDLQDQQSRGLSSHKNRWIIGVSLLVAGMIFLLQNLTNWRIERWWSVLLIIPALASIATAWRRYQPHSPSKRLEVLRPLAMGLLFILIIFVILFHLSWQTSLAIGFILAGIVAVIGVFIR